MTLTKPEQLALLAVIVFATAGLYYWTPEPFLYPVGLAWGLFLAEIGRRFRTEPFDWSVEWKKGLIGSESRAEAPENSDRE